MRRVVGVSLALAVCCAVPQPGFAQQADVEFQALTAGAVINLDNTLPASWLAIAGITWVAPAYAREGGSVNSLQCLATGRNRGEIQRGMTLALEGGIFDENGTQLRNLSLKTRPFNPAARFSWDFPDLSDQHSVVIFDLGGGMSGGVAVDLLKIDCRALNRVVCQRDAQTMCQVGNKRFRVQVDLGQGRGRVVSQSDGLFSLPGSSVATVAVEVFDRCRLNDHFWVAVGSKSTAPFRVVIEDTLSGETRFFSNPGLGMVQVDPSAFPTCP
jgi:hypothetical protein